MNKYLKITLHVLLALVLLVGIGIWQRHYIIANLVSTDHPLLEKVDEGPSVEWFDDWYTIRQLDSNIYAIGEPRYWQRNYNYLIVGENQALLFDAGPGLRDINPVVKSLTNLPYTYLISHLHFDHMGNGHSFPKVAMPDLPHIRKRVKDGKFTPTPEEHLGKTENIPAPTRKIDEWIDPNGTIDLGGRTLNVIYTPGHTSESVSLYDAKSSILFSGDWFTASLGPFLSNSSMEDFYLATKKVLCELPQDTKIYSAHKYVDGGGVPRVLTMQDVKNANDAIDAIRNGKLKSTGVFPAVYEINDRLTLFSDFPWLANWDATYPELVKSNCQ